MKRLILILALALVALPGVSQAQVPPEIAAKLREIGRVVAPAETAALYADIQTYMPVEGVAVERDIAYGPHPLNKMDVFSSSPDTGNGKPVIIFAHGGGFERGDKHNEGSFANDNLMIWAVRNGMVGININYRLAPDDPWPAAQEDLATAIAWAKDNAARYGGDPNKIVLGGQSAGASLVGNHIAFEQFHGPDGIGAVAAFLSSGQFEVTGPSGYYGDDPSKFAERSSLQGIVNSHLPLFINRAELDPPAIAEQGEKLNAALCAAGRCPVFVLSKDHNHTSQMNAIGTDDQTISRPLLAFIRANTQ